MRLNNLFKTILLLLCFLSISQAEVFDPWILDIKPNTSALKGGVSSTLFSADIPTPLDIPDNDSNGLEIPIVVAGLRGNIQSLSVELGIEHTWVGDLTATLTAPNGIAYLVVFSGVGKNRSSIEFGDSSNLSGLYTFDDLAPHDLWSEAAQNDGTQIIAANTYRTSTTGNANNLFGGCTTRLNGAFSRLTPAQSNGTWVLTIKDENGVDTGMVQSAGITIDAGISDLIFKSTFETLSTTMVLLPASDLLGTCKKAQYDFTGSGYSDLVTSYETPDSTVFIETTAINGTQVAANTFNSGLPFADTEVTSGGDFDGDGIKDFVFRRPFDNDVFQYFIRRSSRPDDLPIKVGILNPPTNINLDLQIGDYDGDGLDDLAFFISNDVTSEASYLSIIESKTFSLRVISTTTGITSDFKPAGGFDENGDQISDFMLFTNDHHPTDPFLIITAYDGSNGNSIYDSEDGIFRSDVFTVPGTFFDTVEIDYVISTPQNSNSTINARYTPDFLDIDQFTWFSSPDYDSDISISGDYDGDGIDDYAVWRPVDGSGTSHFFIRPSSSSDPNNNLIMVTPAHSSSTDRPIGNSRVR